MPASPPGGARWEEAFRGLPKAELHVHLEGTIEPATVVALGEKYGDSFTPGMVASRYAVCDFTGFIEAYKWVTSYLREPEDYGLITSRMCEQLLAQNVVYAEVTLSVGVMLLRKQNAAANFRAIRGAASSFNGRGLRVQWIFDAVRQFGAGPARAVAECAAALRDDGVIAFGMGGDELARPSIEFRDVYEYAASHGLHRLVHAGEIGGPESVRDAVDILGAERIGHGIAAAADPQLVEVLARRAIHLEICPTSNVCTGALARQLGSKVGTLADHPLPRLFRAGIPMSISTDDPAMFGTSLNREYTALRQMGLTRPEIVAIAEAAFRGAFLPSDEKASLLQSFRSKAEALGLL